MPRLVRSRATPWTSIRPRPPPAKAGTTLAVISSAASAETGEVGKAIERGTYAGGAYMTKPAGMPSTYASLPQEPHSSSVWETQASFSSPGSPAAHARSAETGSSSQ